MNRKIPEFLLHRELSHYSKANKGKLKLAFIDRTIKKIGLFMNESIVQYENSQAIKFLNQVSAPAILLFFISFIVCISLTHTISGQLNFLLVFLLISWFSMKNLRRLYSRVLLLSLFFGLLIMLPAALNIFTPGKMWLVILRFQSAVKFLIYSIPKEIGITYEGIYIVVRMFLKVFNSIFLSYLVLRIISFSRLVKALKILHVPSVFILILTLTYKYIFILSRMVEEMYLAMRSRWINRTKTERARNIISGRMGMLFKKSWLRYEDTYKAMMSRGFTGEVIITGTESVKFWEFIFLLCLIGLGFLNIIVFRYVEYF